VSGIGIPGARGDGRTLDTRALQAAIGACAARGGGTVLVPAGRYLTGSLSLMSDVTLRLSAGAVLVGSEDPADYPLVASRWEGVTREVHAPVIGGVGLRNVSLVGEGTIDGRGAVWWKRHREKTLSHPRPRLIAFTDCSNLAIRGIRAVDSPSWTINPVRCENVTIDGVTIVNPPDSPNTDGINPDSCSRVFISNCFVSVGDDCIALKSGTEREQPELRAPCRDIAIANCILERGHGGVVIGSEASGGVHSVVITNCIFNGTDRGIRLKSRRGRGGLVEDVRASNIVMNGVLCPFTVNTYYACGAWGDSAVSDKGARPRDDGTPRFRRIALSNVSARGAGYAAAFIYGLAEMPVEEISLSDFSVSMSADAEEGYPEMADGLSPMRRDGLFARYVRGLSLDRVWIDGQRGPAFSIEDSWDVDIRSSGTRTPVPGAEPARLVRVGQSARKEAGS
jgi:polygalacturonase